MWEKQKEQVKKEGNKAVLQARTEKNGNPNKPEERISRTKFHYGRSYYGKELLQQSRRLDHFFWVNE